jgi:hypothetical protein
MKSKDESSGPFLSNDFNLRAVILGVTPDKFTD